MSANEEKIIREAFDAVQMPPALKQSTLDALEQKAYEQNDLGFFATASTSQEGASTSTPPVAQPINTDDNILDVSGTVGQATRAKRAPVPFTRRFGLAIAACMLLCLVAFGGFNAYATETAVIGIEVNPAIELGVNRFDIVVDARALNDDGKRILEEVEVTGKNSEEAIAALTQSEIFLSYIGDDSFVDMYVICDDDRQSATLVGQGEQSVSTLPCEGACNQAGSQTHAEAAQHNMGVGRYEAAKTLMALDPAITIEACETMSMKELRTRIATIDPTNELAWHHNNLGQGSNNGAGQGQGQGQGQGDGQGTGQGSGQGAGQGTGNGQGNGTGQGTGQGDGQGTGQGSGQGVGQGSGHGADHAQTSGSQRGKHSN